VSLYEPQCINGQEVYLGVWISTAGRERRVLSKMQPSEEYVRLTKWTSISSIFFKEASRSANGILSKEAKNAIAQRVFDFK